MPRENKATHFGQHRIPSTSVEFLDAKSQSPIGVVESFSAVGITAQHVNLDVRDGCSFSWSGDVHYVALHDLNTEDAETFADDQSPDRRRDMRGRMTYVPPGCRVWGWSVPVVRPQTVTMVFFDPLHLEPDLGVRLGQLPARAQLYFMDFNLRTTLEKLGSCLASNDIPDRMYLESLCTLSSIEVSLALGGMAESHLKRCDLHKDTFVLIDEYISDNLSADISLADLSKLAGLSRFHFLRVFKQTTRQTPYQHLLRRRIERAQDLLRSSCLSVAEIALATGFRNSTQFAVAFRKLMDRTPSAFRAEARRRRE